MSGVEWVNDAVGHPVGDELTRGEAELVTAKIKGYVGVAWALLLEAHLRKAHKALGYETWADYVETEFEMSRSRSYQLISQARMVLDISEAVSTSVDISEAAARDLAPHREEVRERVADAVAALPDDATTEDKVTVTQRVIEETRTEFRTPGIQAMKERQAREAAEAAARAAEGMNPDGEITAQREDEGVGSSPDPTPSEPTQAEKDDGYRAFIDTALVRLCDIRQMDPERVREVATAEQRNRIASNVAATREWCDAIEQALEARPDLKAV